MPDLISKKTRVEFREYFVGMTLREITQEFEGADVPCDSDYQSPESGQRRSLVEKYYHAVDFSSWRDVQKILRVFEGVLLSLEERVKHPFAGIKDDYAEHKQALLIRCLERDGFRFSDNRITLTTGNPTMQQLSQKAGLLDSHVLRQQIERIRSAVEDDPDLAIGTAKELLETTCRTILADYGINAGSDWDVVRLVKQTRTVLKLVPEDAPDSAKGADTLKRILSNLGQVSQGLAELRNLYGTGHGKSGQFRGLKPRHARLAAGCASTLATFLFETHEARKEKML
jgi:hypothetical protein